MGNKLARGVQHITIKVPAMTLADLEDRRKYIRGKIEHFTDNQKPAVEGSLEFRTRHELIKGWEGQLKWLDNEIRKIKQKADKITEQYVKNRQRRTKK